MADNNVTHRKQRLGAIYSTCRHRKQCVHCSSPCPIVVRRKQSYISLAAEWDHLDASAFSSEEERAYCVDRPLDATLVHEILSAIPDEDLWQLGLNPTTSHPKNMVLSVLLVPPPSVRPSVMVSEGSRARGQDDLTMRLVEIIKRATALRNALRGAKEDHPQVQDLWDKLAQDVAVYIHNTPRGRVSTQRSGVPTKCLFSRLKGKQGRFRSNLMGKRVNFSGRSVISPDPLLDVDEVGVPVEMALCLTQQEVVSPYNLHALTERVRRGAGRLDGAETVICGDGTSIQLEYCEARQAIVLEEGWIVERPLQDGDFLLFNRQPTLHRMSLMGHRVRIMRQGKTLRCNLAVVGPYNADFDGDEMNVHKPQSPAAQSEAELLMSVTSQVVSPQASRPVMGIVQDALLGGHLISSPDVLLPAEDFMAIISSATKLSLERRTRLPPPAYAHPEALWTGRQLIEMMLPPVSMVHGDQGRLWETTRDDGSISTVAEHPLVVRRGRFLSGQFSKATLGTSSGSLVHHVLLAVGNTEAVAFMGDLQRVINRWLLERGFSIGIGDCVPSGTCDSTMHKGIDRVLCHIDALQTEVPKWSAVTLDDGDSGRTSLESMAVERTVHRMVSGVQMSTGKLVRREMSHGNGLGAMVMAGSKGNNINICQIMLCVGQNCVNGERLGRDGSDARTLPSYPDGDRSVDGAGFVSNSYLLGLTAGEAFFHAKGGREGLVDTAVKTSKTGYYQRRLVKGMESHRAEHDLSVRDSSQNIVEFVYGGDAVNPAMLERSPLAAFAMGDASLSRSVLHPGATAAEARHQRRELAALVALRDETREARLHLMTKKVATTTDVAVNPRRVLHSVAALGDDGSPRVSVAHVSKTLAETAEEIEASLMRHATLNLRLALLYELRSAEVVHRHRLTQGRWAEVLRIVKQTVLDSLIEAGEMVGCVAAQSIGEPATQMTLNTFHLAGVAMEGRSQLSGIPRVAEIIDAAKSIKTACMTLRLDGAELEARGGDAEVYARSLEHCLLAKLVTSYEVEECGATCGQHPEDEILVAAEGACFGDACREASTTVLRLTLNRRLLRRRGLFPSAALKAVLSQHPDVIGVASPSASLVWVLRLKVAGAAAHSHEANAAVYSRVLNDTVVGGKAEIELAELCRGSRVVVDDDTGDLEEAEEITIETAGSALQVVTSEPEIDWYRCTSNDVMDVYGALGIEAARAIIFHELRSLVAGDGGKVSDRHIMMVATTMTFYGTVMPMSRHGINRIADTGPLLRCSFEETSEVLTDAGVYGEAESHMRGISQSIMMGKTPYIGTGCCDALQPKWTPEVREGPCVEASFRPPSPVEKAVAQSRFRGERTHCLVAAACCPPSSAGEEGACMQEQLFQPPPPCRELGGLEEVEMPTATQAPEQGGCLETELRDIIRRMPFEPPRSPRIAP